MIARRERGRTALQAADRSTKRANAEKVLRDEDNRLALVEAQKVGRVIHRSMHVGVYACEASFGL